MHECYPNRGHIYDTDRIYDGRAAGTHPRPSHPSLTPLTA